MATTKFIDLKIRSRPAEIKVSALDKRMRGLGKSTDRTTKSFGALSKIATAIGTALSTQQIIKFADAFSSIQNQIRQTTRTTEQLTKRTAELLAVANRSRVGFQETSELYTKLNLSTKDLGLSTEQLLRITETISKSFSVSGKTAAETAQSVRQLGQAFDSGALRGEEFNSIADGAPEIMRALKRSLNLTQGELRDFAATGGITSKILVEALGGAADIIDKKLAASTKTFAQSIQEANNNMVDFIGNSTAIKDVVGGAGEAIVSASNNIELIAKTAVLLASVFAARLIPSLITYTSSVIANTQAQIFNGTAATRTVNVYGVVAVAQAKATVSTNVLTLASRGLSASLAFLGGPLGVALIAAVALVTLSDSIEGVGEKSKLSSVEVDEFTKFIEKLTTTAAKGRVLTSINNEMQELRDKLISASEKLVQFQGFADSPIKTQGVNRYKKEVEDLNNSLDLLSQKQGIILGAPDLSGGVNRGNINNEAPAEDKARTSPFAQETKDLQLALALRQAVIQESINAEEAAEIIRFTDKVNGQQERFILELEKLGTDEAAKAALTEEFRALQIASAQEFEANLTDVKSEGTDERIKLDNDELQSKIQMAQGIVGLMQSFAGKSKKASKALMLIQGALSAYQIYASTEAAAALALAQPPGPPSTIPFAASISAAGKLKAGAVLAGAATSSFSGGGGSGGGSSSATPRNPAPTNAPTTPLERNRVVDVRLDDDAILTGAAVKRLIASTLSSDDDIVLNITNAQSELTRTGVT